MNQRNSFFIAIVILSFLTFNQSAVAQIYMPNTQGTTGTENTLVGSNVPHYQLDQNFPNINVKLEVHEDTVRYGNKTAVLAKSFVNGNTAKGTSLANLATSASWHAQGAVRGVAGYATDVDRLNVTVQTQAASALGGYFHTKINDPIQDPTTGKYYIAGTMSVLDGTINTYPDSGAVTAVYGLDNIKGSGTWAGYFDGRGHFSQNVGIATTNPLSTLSVNSDGHANYGAHIQAPGTNSGSVAVYGNALRPTDFAGWNYGVIGKIEAGYGYANGVLGQSYTATPASAGRAYGVRAMAGNATSNYNYGVFSELRGQNNGTAIIGIDRINNPSWNGNTNGTWAGMFIGNTHISGNVGIGTTAPTTKLDVRGTVSVNDNTIFLRGGGDPHHALAWKGTFNTKTIDGPVLHGFSGGALGSNNWGTENIALRWFNDGKVSIGDVTTPGNYKLYVKDGILTEEVKIALHNSSDWADYVFQDDYNLTSLEDVAKHIEEKGHLHNTPSAKAIAQDGGFEVGEMTVNQQEKIEEIFLHLIEMKKEMKELKAENVALKQQVKGLK